MSRGEYDILRAQPGAQEVLGDARKSGLSPEGYLAEQKKLRRRSRVENLIRRGIREKDALYMTDLEDALEGERLKAERKKSRFTTLSARIRTSTLAVSRYAHGNYIAEEWI